MCTLVQVSKELELQVAVRQPVWALGTKFGSPARAASHLNITAFLQSLDLFI